MSLRLALVVALMVTLYTFRADVWMLLARVGFTGHEFPDWTAQVAWALLAAILPNREAFR